MTPFTKSMLGLAFAGSIPIVMHLIGNEEQKQLAWDLTTIGMVGTGVGTIVGLWAVPQFREAAWISALILTGLSLGTKLLLLPHGEEHETETLGRLPAMRGAA